MSLIPRRGGSGPPDTSASVSQGGSVVLGNQVGGNLNQTNNYNADRPPTVVEQLLVRLQHELDNNIRTSEVLSRLQRYHGGIVVDDVRGLAAKLERAGRGKELTSALERKEMFAKLLEAWSWYASAQEIFAYLLAKAEHFFSSEILPEIGTLAEVEVNRRMNVLIVNPTVEECGATVFQVDHLTAMGMIYWLAEQCFVRWH